MSIDINGIGSNQVASKVNGSAEDAKVKQHQPTPAAAETGKSATTDTVSLSESAKQLERLGNSVTASPVVDTQRVEQIKQAINNGSYKIDPTKIADKLMQFENILKPKG